MKKLTLILFFLVLVLIFGMGNIALAVCTDSDYHKDIFNAVPSGTTNKCSDGTPGSPYWDSCSGNVLTEYYCVGDKCQSFTFDCSKNPEIGSTCNDKLFGDFCNPIAGMRCYDSDVGKFYKGLTATPAQTGGKAPWTKGRCISVGSPFPGRIDSCVPNNTLTEWYCNEGTCASITINCPLEDCTPAAKGACGATVIEPSKVRGANECCLLNHDLTDVDPLCIKGDIVGPATIQWCDANNDGIMDTPDATTFRWGTCCLIDTVYNISDWIFTFFFPVIIIVLVIAAYFFLFSGGDPQRLQKAKNIFLWGVAGFILLIFAKLIPFVIKSIIS